MIDAKQLSELVREAVARVRREPARDDTASRARDDQPSRARDDLIPAAVLVPIVLHPDEPGVLFTRRAMTVAKHKGQVSFPGGACEPADAGPAATALRETREEIGLAPDRVEVVGALEEQVTTTGFFVTPIVGLVEPGAELAPDPLEVAGVFEVPWSKLTDPAYHDVEWLEWRGVSFCNHRYTVCGEVIWGATGRIVARFLAAIEEVRR